MKPPVFALDACSVIDRVRGEIPFFRRSSPVNLISYRPNEIVSVKSIKAHRPAIYENGAILIEKGANQLLAWNSDLSRTDLWIRGQYVNVYPNAALSPDGSKTAALVTWSAVSTGAAQSLERSLSLIAEKTYTLSFLVGLQSKGGSFNETGQIRLTGNVVPVDPIKLSVLNNFEGQYRYLSFTFKAGGQQPKLPSSRVANIGNAESGNADTFNVLDVTGANITIQSYNVGVNDLKGGQVQFQGSDQKHLINGSSASDVNGRVVINTATPSLAAFGVTTSSKARLTGAPEQNATLSFYSESSATLLFAGAFLEEGAFPTSPIFSRGELSPRSNTEYYFYKSPVQDLFTFGVYLQLDYWQGDGNILDLTDFRVFISGGKLGVQVGATQIMIDEALPRFDVKVFVQVALEQTSVAVYLNKQLKANEQIPRYRGLRSRLNLTTEGLRVIKHLFFYDFLVSGGASERGKFATGDLADLFDNANLVISAEMLAALYPVLKLPTVEIPGTAAPKASGVILSLNTSTRNITVSDTSGFSVGDLAVVLRDQFQITWASVQAIPAPGTLTLDNISGINVATDSIVVGNFTDPGRTSVRLPFEASASGVIDIIDPAAKTVRIPSTLSFAKGRAFILSGSQDVKEVVVGTIDNPNQRLTLNDITDIRSGHLIAQAEYETTISPVNYEVSFMGLQPGVSLGTVKSENGFLLFNTRRGNVHVTPLVRVVM
jgi:hypothetical protein